MLIQFFEGVLIFIAPVNLKLFVIDSPDIIAGEQEIIFIVIYNQYPGNV
jgi:hypothetical protein